MEQFELENEDSSNNRIIHADRRKEVVLFCMWHNSVA